MNERKSRIVRVKVEFPLVYDHDLESLPCDLAELFAALKLNEVANRLGAGAGYVDGTGSARLTLSSTKKDLDISDSWRRAQSKAPKAKR